MKIKTRFLFIFELFSPEFELSYLKYKVILGPSYFKYR